MTHDDTESFEWLRSMIDRHPRATSPGARDLVWADAIHSAAVARDHQGSIEIFLVGEPIRPTAVALRDTLQHQEWTTVTGELFAANRMVLPEASNLPGVAAFICAELLANRFAADPQGAFARTEPVIAALLFQQQLGNEILTGLAGEVVLLEELTRQAADPDAVAGSWFGSVPSSRDVQLGEVGIEVKATTGSSSTHSVQGFHQVEVGHPVGDVPETALYLLSIGVRWLPAEATGGTSIPQLVDQVAARLSAQEHKRLLARVRQYGGDAGVGYDHANDRSEPRYARRLLVTFERLYDMGDKRIRVLRSSDVNGVPHVERDSITFRIALPPQVDGDLNPTTDLARIASKLLEEAGFARR